MTYRSLSLRRIHQSRANRSREDDISELLFLKNLRSRLCSVKCTIDIDIHDLLELLRSVLFSSMLGAYSSIGHKNIQLSEILHDLINGSRNFLWNGDIGLVSASFCLIFRSNLFCCSRSCIRRAVEDSDLYCDWLFLPRQVESNFAFHTLAPASAYAVATVRPIPRAPPVEMLIQFDIERTYFPYQ